MREFAENYYNNLLNFANSIRVTDGSNGMLAFPAGIEMVGNLIISQADAGKRLSLLATAAAQPLQATWLLISGRMAV